MKQVVFLSMVLLSAGCASTGEVESLRAEVDALKVKVSQSEQAAAVTAKAEASEAKLLAEKFHAHLMELEAASSAKIKALEASLSKYFKKAQQK